MAEVTSATKYQESTKVVDGVRYALTDGGWKPVGYVVADAVRSLQESRAAIAAAEEERDAALRAITSGPDDVQRANDLAHEIEAKATDLDGSAARTRASEVRIAALRDRLAALRATGGK